MTTPFPTQPVQIPTPPNGTRARRGQEAALLAAAAGVALAIVSLGARFGARAAVGVFVAAVQAALCLIAWRACRSDVVPPCPAARTEGKRGRARRREGMKRHA